MAEIRAMSEIRAITVLHGSKKCSARFAFFYFCFRIWTCNRQCFDADPNPVQHLIQLGCGSGSGTRVLMTKNGKKFTAEIIDIFLSRVAIYLSLGLQPLKKNIQHFKTWNAFPFSIFVGLVTKINADPCGSGTGSETLVLGPQSLFNQSLGIKLIFK